MGAVQSLRFAAMLRVEGSHQTLTKKGRKDIISFVAWNCRPDNVPNFVQGANTRVYRSLNL